MGTFCVACIVITIVMFLIEKLSPVASGIGDGFNYLFNNNAIFFIVTVIVVVAGALIGSIYLIVVFIEICPPIGIIGGILFVAFIARLIYEFASDNKTKEDQDQVKQ